MDRIRHGLHGDPFVLGYNVDIKLAGSRGQLAPAKACGMSANRCQVRCGALQRGLLTAITEENTCVTRESSCD